MNEFEILKEELLKANRQFNLTAATEDVEHRHFADSLSVLQAYSLPENAKVVDVGCGAGFPGLPVKIKRKDLSLFFLDSTAKKLSFVEEMCRKLNLQDTHILCGRAEDFGKEQYREQFDVALSRAVCDLAKLCECSLPLLKVGGVMLAIKGGKAEEELKNAETILALCGGEFQEIKEIVSDGFVSRVVVIRKVRKTPAKYPRRWAQMG